jgi:hypothetical protein
MKWEEGKGIAERKREGGGGYSIPRCGGRLVGASRWGGGITE